MPLNGNELLDLDTLATQIAAAMSDAWQATAAESYSHSRRLVGLDGVELALVVDPVRKSEAGRVEIRGLIPHGLSGPMTRITVAAQRDPNDIAADIERRLLPAHRDALDKARAVQARHEASEQARTAAVNQLLAALGAQGTAGHRPSLVTVGADDNALVHGNAELSLADGSVSIRVTAPIETAEILLRACAALNATHPLVPSFTSLI